MKMDKNRIRSRSSASRNKVGVSNLRTVKGFPETVHTSLTTFLLTIKKWFTSRFNGLDLRIRPQLASLQ